MHEIISLDNKGVYALVFSAIFYFKIYFEMLYGRGTLIAMNFVDIIIHLKLLKIAFR
jgi:hypothetical protein